MTVLRVLVQRSLIHMLLLLALEVATSSTTSTTSASATGSYLQDEDDGGDDDDMSNEEETTSSSCSSSSSSSSSSSLFSQSTKSFDGNEGGREEMKMPFLTPADLPDPVWFTNFSNTIHYELPGGFQRTVQEGMVQPIQRPSDGKNSHAKKLIPRTATATAAPASIAAVRTALDRRAIEQIRSLVQEQSEYLDTQPDTVDALSTYEIYMDSPTIRKEEEEREREMKKREIPTMNENEDDSRRRSSFFLRQQFHALTHSHVDMLTSLVQQHYPDICQSSSSSSNPHHRPPCEPCFSLIRRYRRGERQSHAMHQDGHALVTVVVSLSDHGVDYRGGLYVSTGHGERQFIALDAGDVAMHQPYLYHGVQVLDIEPESSSSSTATATATREQQHFHETERWSWILWYKDGCDEDRGHEWFATCASQGDAVCQYLYSTKDIPGATSASENERILSLTRAAARGGVGEAAVKMARGYLHLLPSPLPYNETLARAYYTRGIQVGNPDAHYGMAQLMLQKLQQRTSGQVTRESVINEQQQNQQQYLRKVIRYLEEAAYLGHSFAAFNLGIVHAFGYGGIEMNMTLSHEWLVQSGLPEGLYIASKQTKAASPDTLASLERRARKLGWGQAWRKQAREQTGSGGAGGVDLNLPWPVSPLGSRPPRV